MTGLPDETDLEDYIVHYLCSQHLTDADGSELEDTEYHQAWSHEYDRDRCLLTGDLIAFLKDSQPRTYWSMVKALGGDEEAAKRSILDRLDSEMTRALHPASKRDVKNGLQLPSGTLSLLRGTLDAGYGAQFHLAYFKPESGLTPEHEQLYRKNRLAIVRQLDYSQREPHRHIIDLAIFLNGLPIATVELKNTLTGQTHHEAIKQYMTSRPVEGEKLLEFKRCLVHFAVGTEQAWMTTRLDGPQTRFFPFNKEAGNVGVTSSESGYRTDYIWEDLLRRDSVMDLLDNFVTVQVNISKEYIEKKGLVDDVPTEALLFPRYHQRRAVHRLIDDVRRQGAGHRYLIQHSAGSGKSNTITWLAFRLASFYRTATDRRTLFDSVLVVTDRRALNRQLHDNVRQYQVEEGEVEFIDEKRPGADLKAAIESRKRIIVTTLQKFPVIADTIELFPDRRYAVIIDEAHSSQTGEDARQMRKALSLQEAEQFDAAVEQEMEAEQEARLDEKVYAEIARKGAKTNVSFFAFTATPKPKTVELFCERIDGEKRPFDTYTMEQAIREEFIRDVMENYMSFARYYKLVRNTKNEDRMYDTKKTVRLLSSYVDLQDVAIERKSRIMIEHFASQTAREIGGRARAMLVTRSRLHAVRYKLKFDSIMQEMRLPYRALVAFSGTVKDTESNMEYTERSMNNLDGNISIPEALKMPQFRILIVANKYQTGFDEPLLHTMFVDKKLGGANAVQTLSRLNRTCRGKDSTLILDFVNDPDEIRESFQQYYGVNYMPEENETDPNSLYDLKSCLYGYNVFTQKDVDDFAHLFFGKSGKTADAKVNKVLDRVCDRAIQQLDDEAQATFRKKCHTFYKLYTFLSQIITFSDVELEKLAPFVEALAKKMPYERESLPYEVLQEVTLESYKLKYLATKTLTLTSQDTAMQGMAPGSDRGTDEPEVDWLSRIIQKLNETFGINLTDEDRVDMERMKERVMANDELMSYFNSDNTRDDIKTKFEEEVDNELLDFINSKLDLYNKLTEDRVNKMFKGLWFNEVYDRKVIRMPSPPMMAAEDAFTSYGNNATTSST